MKALFISNDPNIFKAGSLVRARLSAYAGLIGELHVISRGSRDAEAGQEGALFYYPLRGGKLSSFSAMEKLAKKLVKEKSIDVVSAQDPFEYGYLALRVTRGTGAALHVQIHTDFLSPWFTEGSLKNRIRVFIADRVLPDARGIRVVSNRIRDSVMKRYGSWVPPIAVIPVAFDASVAAKAPFPAHDFTFTLLAASRLEKEKRIGDILKALALVRTRYPNAGLFIAGTGRVMESLRRQAGNLGLSGNVIFLGWRTDVRGLMRSANAFIQASAYEGYGVSLVEAALGAAPIISTDVGIVGEILMPGKDLIATRPGEVGSLAAGITRLIEDNQARHALALSAEEAAKRHVAALADIPARIVDDLAHTCKKG